MGFWGSSLYSNDSTCDIRDGYLNFIREGLSNEEAYEKILENLQDYIKFDEEPLFWFALAETQWKVGRLRPDVKEKALEWIEKNGGLDVWEEENPKGGSGWKKTLQKLRDKLESPIPKEKKLRKPEIPNQDLWNLNDIYAYRMESEYAREQGYFGKYILLQKIDVDPTSGYYPDEPAMRIHIFDKAFDNLPTIHDIEGVRILPLDFVGRQSIREEDRTSCNFGLWTSAVANFYNKRSFPAKKFIFVGNIAAPANKMHKLRKRDNTYFDFQRADVWFIKFHKEWDGITYDTVGDGEFLFVPRMKSHVKGVWGIGLHCNDLKEPLHWRFIDTIRGDGCSDLERHTIIMNEFGHYIGTYMEPLFWYIYAERQWIVGRPTQEVRSKAIEWLDKDGGMELWDDNNSRLGWSRTLDNLREEFKTWKRKK